MGRYRLAIPPRVADVIRRLHPDLKRSVSNALRALGDDPSTTDEGLYIPTGYRYVTERNARIGFEHPPLIRDLAVLPLLFLILRPARSFFKTDVRGRLSEAAWEAGDAFIYEQPETPDR